jgi:phage repressor protein C with HTH and peptisase S24 domain
MTIGANIRKLRKEKGLTLNQLAAQIESDVGNLSRLERDQQGYTDALLNKIADALGVAKAVLFMEESELEGAKGFALRSVVVVDDDDPKWVHIRKVKLRLTAGFNGFETEPEVYDGDTLAVPADWLRRHNYDPEKLYVLRIDGESMEPTLYEDDVVIINTADKALADGAVFAFNYEGESVVKRLQRDAGDWWMTSDNQDKRKYGRKVCRGECCLIIGRVIRRESERL